MEFSNKSPLEDKEKAERSKKKPQDMDQEVHKLRDEMLRGLLDVQDDQPTEELQRKDDDVQHQIDDEQVHITIKSFFAWKSRPNIIKTCNDEIILFI